MDLDHIGGAGDTHGHTGSNDHQIALLHEFCLLCRLDGELDQLVGVLGIGHQQGHHAPVQGHLPLDPLTEQAGHHRGAGAETAHQPGGGTALADGEDGIGTDVHGSGAGGMGRGGGDGQAAGTRQVAHPLGVVDVRLGPQGNGIHGLHRLHGVFARRCLAGEHDGGGSVVDGVGHVGDLRPGGAGILHHRVQHLCGCDDRLAGGHALGDHVLLDDGNLCEVDLHAHIPPGHHDAVRHGQDLRQVADPLLVFNLGDDLDGGVCLIQQAADLPHVVRRADEAGGDEVKALFHAEEDVLPVPLAHVGHGQADARHIDALVVFHGPVVFHPAADVRRCGLQHRQAHQAVVQQDGVAGLHVPGQVGVGDGAALLIPHDVPGGQGELLAGPQHDGTCGEGLQPDLRPLGVQHGGHRQAQLRPQGLQGVQTTLVLRVAAVGEIEPGHVHAGLQHLPQDALPVRGRTEGAHDLCLSHK